MRREKKESIKNRMRECDEHLNGLRARLATYATMPDTAILKRTGSNACRYFIRFYEDERAKLAMKIGKKK